MFFKSSVKRKKFYRFLLKDNKNEGVLYAPKGTSTFFGQEVLPVENYEDMVFTLKDGIYTPFIPSNVRADLVNEELKLLIESQLPADYPLEFLPVKTVSEEFGNNLYYIVHFTKVFDVVDPVNSVKVPHTGSIIKPYIDYEKAKDLDFFNSTHAINVFIVSDKIKKLMKKNNLDAGIEFKKVPYVL